MNFLQTLSAHLNLVPNIIQAVQAFQTIGHSKETTVQKIGQMIELSAAIGEQVPVPVVVSVSTLVESIAQQIFAPPSTSGSAAVPAAAGA